jgi:preprotein translocase subunit SecD
MARTMRTVCRFSAKPTPGAIMTRVSLPRLVGIFLLIAFAAWVVWPENRGIELGPLRLAPRVVEGLDLRGGVRVLLEADVPETTPITADQLQVVRQILENRVNGLGVTEPIIQLAGQRRILVEIPGIENPDEAIATIRQTGLLEFVEVDEVGRAFLLRGEGPVLTDLDTGALPADSAETEAAASTPEAATPSGAEPTEVAPTATPMVFHTVMTGAVLADAGRGSDGLGRPAVDILFTDEGARIFADYTTSHVNGYLAIILDKQVLSIPQIGEPITDGEAQISGDFTNDEANALAVQLKYGALPVPLRIVENKTVGPTLGQDSLRASTEAGVIGLSAVVLFMALYYRLPGLLADLALVTYALITFALFKLIPVTLTLPGIAGFVLSIGVAVDANVLIFERMKEELRAGRPLQRAIDLGFSRAWPSIRDSNLSTLITCGILYWLGSAFGASIVKGFSLTLALGVAVSLFTAITVTRTFLHLVLDSIQLESRPWLFGV